MYVAIIPARGGSKGVKDKNLQLVGGISLVGRAILSAQKAGIEKIIVSTDSEKIAQEAQKYQATVHRRSEVTASDTAKTIEVVSELYHDLSLSSEDICVLLQPTSPLRDERDIICAIEKFESQNIQGSVVSVVEVEHHPYKMLLETDGKIIPLKDRTSLEMPRQALPKALRVNGAVYVITFKALLGDGSFFAEPVACVEMNANHSVDIDTYDDLVVANHLIENR